MELRQRLSGINALEWFLISFCFLIVGAAGYALGTSAVTTKTAYPDKQINKTDRQLVELYRDFKSLQGDLSSPQNAGPGYDAPGGNNPQQTPPIQPYESGNPYDVPLNPVPRGCKPYQPTVDMNCPD